MLISPAAEVEVSLQPSTRPHRPLFSSRALQDAEQGGHLAFGFSLVTTFPCLQKEVNILKPARECLGLGSGLDPDSEEPGGSIPDLGRQQRLTERDITEELDVLI